MDCLSFRPASVFSWPFLPASPVSPFWLAPHSIFSELIALFQTSWLLAHQLGQAIRTGDPDLGHAGKGRLARSSQHFIWQLEEANGTLTRTIEPESRGQNKPPRLILNDAWLAAHSQPGVRLSGLARQRACLVAGRCRCRWSSAIQSEVVGRIVRNGKLFVQAPMRWDDSPGSPLLIAQQALSLPFSLSEIAAVEASSCGGFLPV